MIQKQEVMGLLLSACPSYTARWHEYLKENASYGEEQLLYIYLCDFANHIVDLYTLRRIHEFPAVFGMIERLHVDGDEFVKEAAAIGLLEDIQNAALQKNMRLEEFVCFLEPESLKQWETLVDFWNPPAKRRKKRK